MKTETFIKNLQTHDHKPLVFAIGDNTISPGYHVTEVKAVSIQSMDCGGQGNAWQETIIQLWVPDNNQDTSTMSTTKFLSIYERVTAQIAVQDNATVRVEYGDVGSPALNYVVTNIDISEQLTIQLEAPAVACKGADRSVGDIPVLTMVDQTTCCTPNNAIPLATAGACCG